MIIYVPAQPKDNTHTATYTMLPACLFSPLS